MDSALGVDARRKTEVARMTSTDISDLLGSIDFVVQDIVEPASLHVVGIEVLMRSDVGPLNTLRTARRLGLETALAVAMAHHVVESLDHEHIRLPVWFNIEPSLFSDREAMTEVLDTFQQIPNQLVVELTERRFGTADDLVATRRMCAGRGVLLALDDFRDTQMHWDRLQALVPDAIKIDDACVSHSGVDHLLARSRTNALATMLRRHYPLVVQEGVELEEQRSSLPAGVLAQGYYFGRPQPLSVLSGR
jgi:EAL domain-containing protein (putative c-di-GMP-specific phosphodiesterase class I)